MSDDSASDHRPSPIGKVAIWLRAQRIRWLMTALTVGLVGSTAILMVFPKAWMLGMLLVAATGAALWGLVDRALTEVRARPTPGGPVAVVYESLRWVAAAISIIAIVEFMLSALHVILGGGWN